MFVCTPSAKTFDGLLEMASERGSWDGGDQGLLNDFFPNWNRLSFTYNVTPSAYYTYAPAYKRHGSEIKVVHFIGQDKPWHQAGQRQNPSTSVVTNNGKAQHDYASLLDRWFSVYQRYFGTTNNTTFTFPTLQAVWDAPSSSLARAAYTPPSLEQLKKQFQGVHDAHNIAMGGYKSNLSLKQQAGMRSMEGHYVSMPLAAGRPDLLGARVFVPKVAQPPTPEQAPSLDQGAGPTVAPTHIVSPTPIKPEIQVETALTPPQPQEHHHHHHHQEHHHHHQQPAETKSWSPQNVSWDPARSEPPKNDRPQMEAGFHYQAENVWDAPRSSSSQKNFFKPPVHYGSIPAVTHQNYSEVARASPDQSKLKPVFPWESTSSYSPSLGGAQHGHQAPYKPTRVFPPEQQREKMKLTPSRPAPPPPTGSSNSPSSSRSHTPSNAQYHYDQHHSHDQHHQQHHHHHHAHSGYDGQHRHGQNQQGAAAPSPVITDFANLSSAYGNAWDSVEGIRRYAKNLQGNGNGGRSASANGRRHGPGVGGNGGQSRSSSSSAHHHNQHSQHSSSASYSSTAGSTASGGSASHPHAPSTSSAHSRSASYQAGMSTNSGNAPRSSSVGTQVGGIGGNAGDHSRQRTTSSTGSGYDTGGEASSRDGDDEDEDDEDDPIDRRVSIKFRSSNRGLSPASLAPTSLPSHHHQQQSQQHSSAATHQQGGSRFLPTSRTSSSETVTPASQSSSSFPGSSASAGITNLPDTSSGAYKPQRVSRVFDPATATDVIRKEGLDALHRFVRSMEAKGAAANGKTATNGRTVAQ